ncbi:MAG TPA: hypothetical protein VGX68_26800 [Thermoanaerobaculia bacterium]|jgi:hypothetical protein|nr:hypothetical protein [Thermoanaerobaculia bacterium]
MLTFVSTLLVGAVAGFAMEKTWGSGLVRWSRMQRMRMRVLRRQGLNPWRAWFDFNEED